MNKKTGFVVLGIALVGGLIYFGSYSNQSENPLVVVDKPVVPVSTDQPVTAEQYPVEEQQPTRKFSDSTSEAATATTTAHSEKQQAPELEPEIREALSNMLNTSSEGLVEETHNGVTSVDLQGRFQTAPVATIDEDGNVQITDYSHLPKASPKQ